MTTRLNESQCIYISIFADELRRILKGRAAEDILSRQVVNVLLQIDRYMSRYPNPADAAKAMRYTCKIDFGRDESKQRGEGVRRGRIVEQLTRITDDTFAITDLDIADPSATDPESQAIERDLCRQEFSKLKPVVAMGVELEASGYNRTEAAKKIGVTRTYLSRQMKKSEREMQRANKPAA